MDELLPTPVPQELTHKVGEIFYRAFDAVNGHRFDDSTQILIEARALVAEALLEADHNPDSYFNSVYVLECCVRFFEAYTQLWKKITAQTFAASWSSLQDCLDSILQIKRFSSLDLSQFESQLLALEQIYPYKIFASVGMIVDSFECSICHKDIDSDECPHRRGHLYRGVIAVAFARNVTGLDHVAMVENPEDKRCVITIEDTAPAFNGLRYFHELLASRKLRISDFAGIEKSTKRIHNPQYRKQERNERCLCGSGKKFKNCCMGSEFVDKAHIDIVANLGYITKPLPLAGGAALLVS